jgi:hypothetical protein
MEILTSRSILAVTFFLLMLLSGVALSRKGKPYHKTLFAVHKIATLLTIFFVARLIILVTQTAETVQPIVTLLWVSGALFVVSFVSGALLSFEKPMPAALTKLHRFSALLVTLLAAVIVFLAMR